MKRPLSIMVLISVTQLMPSLMELIKQRKDKHDPDSAEVM